MARIVHVHLSHVQYECVCLLLTLSLSCHFPFHSGPDAYVSVFMLIHLLDDGVFSICEFERRKFSFETYAILIVGVYLPSYVYAFDRSNDQISPLHIKVCCMRRRCYTTPTWAHCVRFPPIYCQIGEINRFDHKTNIYFDKWVGAVCAHSTDDQPNVLHHVNNAKSNHLM